MAYLKGRKKDSKKNDPETDLKVLKPQDSDRMFVSDGHQPLSLVEIEQLWQKWTQPYRNFNYSPITIEQARHTWCLEMLARGIDVDSFCIISGLKPKELQAYQIRLKEKLAVDQAIALDS
jgi:hypothetical protein